MWWYAIQNLGMGDFNPAAPLLQLMASRLAKAKRHKTNFRYAATYAGSQVYGVVAAVTAIPTPQPPPAPLSIPGAKITKGGQTQRSTRKPRTINVRQAQPTPQLMQTIPPLR